jgi:acetolactate synthase I/III small subunit
MLPAMPHTHISIPSKDAAVIELRVSNHPGAMARITGLFAHYSYNLEAIICVPLLPDGKESRMLLLVADAPNLAAIERQLTELADVLSLRHRADLSPEFFLWMDEMGSASH